MSRAELEITRATYFYFFGAIESKRIGASEQPTRFPFCVNKICIMYARMRYYAL